MDDKECCSGRCAPSADGPNRCVSAPGCQPEQERCASDTACCSGACKLGPEGVGRCAKPSREVADRCRVIGELCMKAEECCKGASCRADTIGRLRCLPAGGGCAAVGYPCAVAEQCCSGRCLPDGAGGYACRDACAPLGAGCVAPEDCCGGSCVGPPGAAACVAVTKPPGPVCAVAGESCDAMSGSCCAGTVCAQVEGGAQACGVSIQQ
jgi:hypothetical protein